MVKTTNPFTKYDRRFMGLAIGLARRGMGNTWPNPAVGCVLVRPDLGTADNGGRIVGRGWTQPGGRPHAETQALGRAGDLAKGATAYVSLEPCCHTGKTGPCTQALIGAGVARVVVAMEDPDPRVAGQGSSNVLPKGVHWSPSKPPAAWTAVLPPPAGTANGSPRVRRGHAAI